MLALALRRARAHPAPLVAVAVNVLIVCTLVAGIGASLPLVQQASLQTRLAETPPDDAVISYVTTYDAEDQAGDDAAIRTELDRVTSVAGGDVVRRLDSGTYDQLSGNGPAWSFTSLTGAEDRLRLDQGGAPTSVAGGPLEVAVPVGSRATVGDQLTLRNRADERDVQVVVVGVWAVAADDARWFGTFEGLTLLLAAEDFDEVDGAGSSARWRAVPALERLEAGDLAELRSVVAAALETGLDRAAETAEASVRAESTELPSVLDERARELVVLRALLLVPAAMLLLLGGACLFLVATALADARRGEAALMRSRGAGPRQLFSPTVLESLVLCGLAVAVSPLLARWVIRLGDLQPPLSTSPWVAAAIAGVVCLVALVLPVGLRALTGDRGEQLSVEKQRRRRLTALVAAVLLVSVLGALAVLQLRGFGSTVTSGAEAATVDPLLVTSPALLLLALAVLVALLALPVVLRLLTGLRSRGVAMALGSRFAARATSRTVPLALVVTLASGTLAFAATQRLSSADARDARVEFEVGTDVRVVPPASALRAGAVEERAFLADQPGVTALEPVHRDQTFLADLPAGMLVIPFADGGDTEALPPGSLTQAERERLVARPWADPEVGMSLPQDPQQLRVEMPGERLEQVGFLFADPGGELTTLAARGQGPYVDLDVAGLLPPESRLVAVRTGTVVPDERGSTPLEVIVDGEQLTDTARWWTGPGEPGVVTLGQAPDPTEPVPVALSTDLAAAASLEVGEVFELAVLGVPAELEVAALVPYVRTTAESDGSGILADASTVLPPLFVAGFVDAPDEWWLQVDDDRTRAVAAAVAERPEIAESVITSADVSARLDDDPSTGGSALAELLVLTSGGGLVVGALLLLSVVLLRRREHATQDRTLVTVGARRRDLLGVIGTEYALTTGASMLFGVLVGVVVAQVTLVSMTLGPDGQLLVPQPELHVPGPTIALPLAAMALVPLLAMALLTRVDQARDRTKPERGGR